MVYLPDVYGTCIGKYTIVHGWYGLVRNFQSQNSTPKQAGFEFECKDSD